MNRPSGKYRGALKVAGVTLTGWLMNAVNPGRRVRFNLVIDDQFRGTYVANRHRKSLVQQGEAGENAHGFSIPIRRAWITGKVQTIRLEDPGDLELELSLAARLGPMPNQHFDEHIVSGQVLIGERASRVAHAQSEGHADDERDQDIRAGESIGSLLPQIGALSDEELINLLIAVDRSILLDRIAQYDKSEDWQSLLVFRRLLVRDSLAQLPITFGRNAIKAHNYPLAGRVLAGAATLHPRSFEANYQAGIARSLQGEFDDALRYLRLADQLEEGTVRAKREMIVLLAKMLRSELPADRREEIQTEHLAFLRELSQSSDAGIRNRSLLSYASALQAAGRHSEAIAAADAVLSSIPFDIRALMVKAKALVARNAVVDAHMLFEKILEIEPGHRGARMNLRVLKALVEGDMPDRGAPSVDIAQMNSPNAPGTAEGPHPSISAKPQSPVFRRLAEGAQNWICTTESPSEEQTAPAVLARLDILTARRVGFAIVRTEKGRKLEFWHRDALSGLAESGLIDSLDDTEALARWKTYFRAPLTGRTKQGSVAHSRGIAALVLPYSGAASGDGESFLHGVTEHLAARGFVPVIVSVTSELRDQESTIGGLRHVLVGNGASGMRKFVLEGGVSLVHAISGAGFIVAEALSFTNIPFVYGVHSWNEMLGHTGDARYFDGVTSSALPRREFFSLLSRATAIYTNSRFTQKVIEDGFGVRCPVARSFDR